MLKNANLHRLGIIYSDINFVAIVLIAVGVVLGAIWAATRLLEIWGPSLAAATAILGGVFLAVGIGLQRAVEKERMRRAREKIDGG